MLDRPNQGDTTRALLLVFFAGAVCMPHIFHMLFAENTESRDLLSASWGMPLYTLIYVISIIFFCYFYTAIIFNPEDVADNMRKYGGFVPGIRSGKPTADYINQILTHTSTMST